VTNAFIDRLHDEALSLLVASRELAMETTYADSRDDEPAERLSVALASLHLTAFVADAVAWTLAQKALAAGQISEQEAASDQWAPSPLTFDDDASPSLPPPLIELIERARLFQRRVATLHAQQRQEISRRRDEGGEA
jgi:regulator of CtrA degradation